MAKDSNKVVQFPSVAKETRIRIKEARLEELEWENSWLHHEIEQNQKRIKDNTKRVKEVLKELAILCNFETDNQDNMEFMQDFDMDFDLTEFNPEEDK
jgi:predicted transcriptional regulator